MIKSHVIDFVDKHPKSLGFLRSRIFSKFLGRYYNELEVSIDNKPFEVTENFTWVEDSAVTINITEEKFINVDFCRFVDACHVTVLNTRFVRNIELTPSMPKFPYTPPPYSVTMNLDV